MNTPAKLAALRAMERPDAALVCLNPQQEQLGALTPASARSVTRAIGRMELCLNAARAQRLPVIHVFTTPASPSRSQPLSAMASLRPKPDETVMFKDGLSFFESPEFSRINLADNYTTILMMGFTLAADCLAAAIDSVRSQKRLVLIEDAIASFDLPPYSAAESEGVIFALLGQFASIITSDELSDFINPQQRRKSHVYSRH